LTPDYNIGYTNGMKTAISLPDYLFKKAETYARNFNKSRSQLYTEALTEYLLRHSPDSVTEAMNKVCENLGEYDISFVSEASRKVLTKESSFPNLFLILQKLELNL
jgi:hypothetical protein